MALYARKIVGWSMKPMLAHELVLDALLMALWRRKPKHSVLVHLIRAPNTTAMTGAASVRQIA